MSMDTQRDGIKTYMNAIYHARFDCNATDFGGMNYPYKEHIVAATELPGLTILLQWLAPIFPHLPDYVYGITHLLLLFSMLLSAMLLYLIFRQLSLPEWYSVAVSIGLMFLSPQNLRVGAHLGLAPLFVIPAILYGLILLEKRPRYSVSITLTITLLIASLLHFYFFAMGVMVIGLYFCFGFLLNYNRQWVKTRLPHYAMMLGLPILLMGYWLVINDSVTDRSSNPYGFLIYRSKWEGIFLSPEMPYWHWVDENLIKIERVEFEGWAYVDLVAGIFMLVTLLKLILNRFQKPILPLIGNSNRQTLYPMIGMSIVMGLYSCSQPFAIKAFEFLLDYAGPLRQFRSTGRFAWVVFYVLNIFAFTSIYNWLTSWKKNAIKYVAFFVVLGVLSYEAANFTTSKYLIKPLKTVPELADGHKFTDIAQFDFQKYQAILPLPYFNVGSNNFGAPGSGNIIQLATVMSAQTGLPLTGAMLTRSSRMQAFRQMQLIGLPYQHPMILDDYPNQKPLIVLLSSLLNKGDSLLYLPIVSGLPLLYKTDRWSLYELDLPVFQRRIAERKAQLLKATKEVPLFQTADFLSTDSVQNYLYESFDNLPTKLAFEGAGTFESDLVDQKLLFDGRIPNAKAGSYELLLWVFVNGDQFSTITLQLNEIGSNGEALQKQSAFVGNSIIEYDSRGWVLIKKSFELKADNSRLSLSLFANEAAGKSIKVDELLIKPVSTDLYKIDGKELWWNNRSFE